MAGEVTFQSVDFRFAEGAPLVVANVNFQILQELLLELLVGVVVEKARL